MAVDLPLSRLNFTRDCVATDKFWDTYIDPQSPNHGEWQNGWPLLLAPAIPAQYADTPNATLTLLGERLMKNPNFIKTLSRVSKTCRSRYCRGIDFTGNADIAGIGAIAAYATIAALTSVISIAAFRYFNIKEKEKESYTETHGEEPSEETLRKIMLDNRLPKAFRAIVPVSISFYDTIICFNIMTSVAGIIFSRTASTIYEKSLCVLVAFLACSANSICTTVLYYPQGRWEKTTRPLSQMIGLIACLSFTLPTVVEIQHLSPTLEDVYCYGAANLPYNFMIISAWIQVGYYALTTLLVATVMLGMKAEHWFENRFRMSRTFLGVFAFTVFTLELVMMWVNFVFIIIIRQQAKSFFGETYADNAFGYGQILASGFCLQAVLQYLFFLIEPVKATESDGSNSTEMEPLSTEQPDQSTAESINDLQSSQSRSSVESAAESFRSTSRLTSRTQTLQLEEGMGPTTKHRAKARSTIDTSERLPNSDLTAKDTGITQSANIESPRGPVKRQTFPRTADQGSVRK